LKILLFVGLFLTNYHYWTSAITRDWPWVQSGFFTLHAITMLMKIHSYIAYNGELSEKLIQLKKSEATYAQMKKDDPKTADDDSDDSRSESSSQADHTYDHDTTDSPTSDNEQDANRLHHRLASEAAAALLQDAIPSDSATINAGQLAAEIEELRSDLKCQNGELWPANVTVANFFDYLIVPSLIYELQYPRTSRYDFLMCDGARSFYYFPQNSLIQLTFFPRCVCLESALCMFLKSRWPRWEHSRCCT
jgi:sterol O-acyltransferase